MEAIKSAKVTRATDPESFRGQDLAHPGNALQSEGRFVPGIEFDNAPFLRPDLFLHHFQQLELLTQQGGIRLSQSELIQGDQSFAPKQITALRHR